MTANRTAIVSSLSAMVAGCLIPVNVYYAVVVALTALGIIFIVSIETT